MNRLFLLIFFLFSFPCQAEKLPCKIKGAPCYIKSKMIAVREKPLLNAKTTFSAIPASEAGRYYYLKDIRHSEGQEWGYFKPVTENITIDAITGKVLETEGWLPLDDAFHDVDMGKPMPILSDNADGLVTFLPCKPDKNVILVHNKYQNKIYDIWFPAEEAFVTIQDE